MSDFQFTMTILIIVFTVLVSIGGFSSEKIKDDLIFYPPAITQRNQWYRFFTCGLIHADIMHLVFNMLSLYLFGGFVEDRFIEIFGVHGKWFYLLLYVTALLVSLVPTYMKHRNDYNYRGLGASGAVSAVVFAGLMIAPYVQVGLFIIPPIIPGFIFGPLYLLITSYMDRKGRDNINHSAHFWGAIYGVAFVIVAESTVGRNAITEFVEGVKYYMRSKGWIQ